MSMQVDLSSISLRKKTDFVPQQLLDLQAEFASCPEDVQTVENFLLRWQESVERCPSFKNNRGVWLTYQGVFKSALIYYCSKKEVFEKIPRISIENNQPFQNLQSLVLAAFPTPGQLFEFFENGRMGGGAQKGKLYTAAENIIDLFVKDIKKYGLPQQRDISFSDQDFKKNVSVNNKYEKILSRIQHYRWFSLGDRDRSDPQAIFTRWSQQIQKGPQYKTEVNKWFSYHQDFKDLLTELAKQQGSEDQSRRRINLADRGLANPVSQKAVEKLLAHARFNTPLLFFNNINEGDQSPPADLEVNNQDWSAIVRLKVSLIFAVKTRFSATLVNLPRRLSRQLDEEVKIDVEEEKKEEKKVEQAEKQPENIQDEKEAKLSLEKKKIQPDLDYQGNYLLKDAEIFGHYASRVGFEEGAWQAKVASGLLAYNRQSVGLLSFAILLYGLMEQQNVGDGINSSWPSDISRSEPGMTWVDGLTKYTVLLSRALKQASAGNFFMVMLTITGLYLASLWLEYFVTRQANAHVNSDQKNSNFFHALENDYEFDQEVKWPFHKSFALRQPCHAKYSAAFNHEIENIIGAMINQQTIVSPKFLAMFELLISDLVTYYADKSIEDSFALDVIAKHLVNKLNNACDGKIKETLIKSLFTALLKPFDNAFVLNASNKLIFTLIKSLERPAIKIKWDFLRVCELLNEQDKIELVMRLLVHGEKAQWELAKKVILAFSTEKSWRHFNQVPANILFATLVTKCTFKQLVVVFERLSEIGFIAQQLRLIFYRQLIRKIVEQSRKKTNRDINQLLSKIVDRVNEKNSLNFSDIFAGLTASQMGYLVRYLILQDESRWQQTARELTSLTPIDKKFSKNLTESLRHEDAIRLFTRLARLDENEPLLHQLMQLENSSQEVLTPLKINPFVLQQLQQADTKAKNTLAVSLLTQFPPFTSIQTAFMLDELTKRKIAEKKGKQEKLLRQRGFGRDAVFLERERKNSDSSNASPRALLLSRDQPSYGANVIDSFERTKQSKRFRRWETKGRRYQKIQKQNKNLLENLLFELPNAIFRMESSVYFAGEGLARNAVECKVEQLPIILQCKQLLKAILLASAFCKDSKMVAALGNVLFQNRVLKALFENSLCQSYFNDVGTRHLLLCLVVNLGELSLNTFWPKGLMLLVHSCQRLVENDCDSQWELVDRRLTELKQQPTLLQKFKQHVIAFAKVNSAIDDIALGDGELIRGLTSCFHVTKHLEFKSQIGTALRENLQKISMRLLRLSYQQDYQKIKSSSRIRLCSERAANQVRREARQYFGLFIGPVDEEIQDRPSRRLLGNGGHGYESLFDLDPSIRGDEAQNECSCLPCV